MGAEMQRAAYPEKYGPQEKLRGARLVIANIHKLVEAQAVPSPIKATDGVSSEKITQKLLKRWTRLLARELGHAVPELGPISYVISEELSTYLDTTLADTLGTVGGVHFKAAQAELIDAQNESTPLGKRTHRERAAGNIGAAYSFWEHKFALDEYKPLTKNRRIEAHLNATYAALILGAINYHNPHTQEAVATWAENAKKHFQQYNTLAQNRINQLMKNEDVAGQIADAATLLPQLLIQGVDKLINDTEIEPSYFQGKADERSRMYKERLEELGQEKKDFYKLYQRLTRDNPQDSQEKT